MRPKYFLLVVLASTPLFSGIPTVEEILALGERQFEEGEYEQALRAFRAADSAAGEPCAPCDKALARTQLALGHFQAAVRRARGALKLAPDTETRMVLGRGLIRGAGAEIAAKDLAEAEAIFRELAADGDAPARLRLAQTLLRGGRDAEAKKLLRAYLKSEPTEKGAARARVLLERPYCGRSNCLPEFSVEALDGTTIDNGALIGDVVLLDFWATWCAPCIDAIPHLKAFTQRYADAPFRLVSFSMDSDEAILNLVIKRHEMDWTQVWDPSGRTIRGHFRVRNFPTHVILDHRGVVRAQYTGWDPNFATQIDETLERLVDEAIAATPDAP